MIIWNPEFLRILQEVLYLIQKIPRHHSKEEEVKTHGMVFRDPLFSDDLF